VRQCVGKKSRRVVSDGGYCLEDVIVALRRDQGAVTTLLPARLFSCRFRSRFTIAASLPLASKARL